MTITLIAKINDREQTNNYHNIYFDNQQNYFFNKFSELNPRSITQLLAEYRAQSFDVTIQYKQFTKAIEEYYQNKI